MWSVAGWFGIAGLFGVLAYTFGKLSDDTKNERDAILSKAHPGAYDMPTSDFLPPAVADSIARILTAESVGFNLAMCAAIVSCVAALLSALWP